MPDYRLTAQLQHRMQYPAGHLDRFANFGPAFEMDELPRAQQQAPARMPEPEPQQAPEPQQQASTQFDARRFITAGQAIFTLQGIRDRYTYRVSKKEPEPGSRFTEPAYFIGLLTGADNTSDYTYIGMLDVRQGQIRLTKASRYTADSSPVKAFNWAIGRIWRGVGIEPARLYHMGKCGRCGRALTVPSSIESGFGPECLGKL